jgi:hypothetical protein
VATAPDGRVRARPRVEKRVRQNAQAQQADHDKDEEDAYLPLIHAASRAALVHVRLRCARSITVGNQISQSEFWR